MEKIKEEVKKLHSAEALPITIDKVNEIVDWIEKISERIGLMEDEYKEHLYGTGYKEQGM